MKTIQFTSAAAKQFDRLPAVAQGAIEKALSVYAITGDGDVKSLTDREGFRMRVGEYRIIFNDQTTILAIHIGRRTSTTYQELSVTNIQHIKTPGGEELVILARNEFEQLAALARRAAESDNEAADVAAYDKAMAALADGSEVVLPADLSMLILSSRSRIAAVRKWRGMSQVDLAAAVGVKQGYLSDIETGRRDGAPDTIARLAAALDVPIAWIER